jgi:hypothetical protein
MRALVRAAIPARAFLRRDRGDALYLTDAPRHGFSGQFPGLRAETDGGLMRLYIKEEILAACDFLPDDTARSLARFRDAPATGAALSLFTQGLKILEAPDEESHRAYDKKVRHAAAVALRTNEGGGLYACALVLAEIGRRMEK